MQDLFKCVKNINKISRAYIKIGNVIVFTVFFLAAFCSMSMGRIGNYDYLFFLKAELLVLGKEMVGAIYVPALLVEIFSLAEKYSI